MKKRSLSVFIIGFLFFAAIISYASASTIYGCYNNQSGTLRIVSASTACRPSETAIQLASPTAPTGITRGVHGTVDGGNPPSIISGTGFSVTRSDTGRYQVTFTNAFTETPDCVLAGTFADELHFCGYDASSRGIFVFCVEPTINAPDTPGESIEPGFHDTFFSFICVE